MYHCEIYCVKFLAQFLSTESATLIDIAIAYSRSFPSIVWSRHPWNFFLGRSVSPPPRDPEILLPPKFGTRISPDSWETHRQIWKSRSHVTSCDVSTRKRKREREKRRKRKERQSRGSPQGRSRGARQNRPERVASDERTEDPGVPCDCSRMRDGRRHITGFGIVPLCPVDLSFSRIGRSYDIHDTHEKRVWRKTNK